MISLQGIVAPTAVDQIYPVGRCGQAVPVPVASMAEPVAIEYAKDKLYVASGVFGGPGQVTVLLP